jgi:hypothetical protein
MSVPDRIYQMAKAYLDAARGRLEEIDSRASAEIDKALAPGGSASPSNISDPMDRAAAKIAAARGEAAARSQLPQRYNFSTADPSMASGPDPDPVQTAYRVIGVPIGSDVATIDSAVAKLRERAAPEKFPEGSTEREDAARIQARVDNAYAVLQEALGIQKNRFDRLEL